VRDGTNFEVTLITTGAAQRRQASSILAASLAQCGVKVEVETMDAASLYAPGPEGVLFGRNFDLAEFAMGTTAMEPACEWFTSSQVPMEANHWVGTNVSGYANPVFDAACQDFQASLPDDENHLEKAAAVQEIFTQDLPVIPLYWRLKTAAARMEVCNFAPDPSASSSLWNIEALYPGTGCTP
jgi:peptide/nickel transport system substrate-binding protein